MRLLSGRDCSIVFEQTWSATVGSQVGSQCDWLFELQNQRNDSEWRTNMVRISRMRLPVCLPAFLATDSELLSAKHLLCSRALNCGPSDEGGFCQRANDIDTLSDRR